MYNINYFQLLQFLEDENNCYIMIIYYYNVINNIRKMLLYFLYIIITCLLYFKRFDEDIANVEEGTISY